MFTLSGTIGSDSAEELDQTIQQAFGDGYYQIILDLDNVNLITSAGLRVMLKTAKQCQKNNGQLKLLHVSKSLKEIFEIIGISFDIYQQLPDAIGS